MKVMIDRFQDGFRVRERGEVLMYFDARQSCNLGLVEGIGELTYTPDRVITSTEMPMEEKRIRFVESSDDAGENTFFLETHVSKLLGITSPCVLDVHHDFITGVIRLVPVKAAKLVHWPEGYKHSEYWLCGACGNIWLTLEKECNICHAEFTETIEASSLGLGGE